MIRLHQEEIPEAVYQARKDYATVTGENMFEKPYWFYNDTTGQEFHSLHSCIGWPQKIAEAGNARKGYTAIIGVVKESEGNAAEAKFLVLDEGEDSSVDNLLVRHVAMRDLWGFGQHPDLLKVTIGDHTRFESVVGNFNARIIEANGNDKGAVLMSPPDDNESPESFDIYIRRLQAVLSSKAKRLYLGKADIIKNRVMEFGRDDPAVTAVGGLVHSLVQRTPWMEQTVPSVFAVNF